MNALTEEIWPGLLRATTQGSIALIAVYAACRLFPSIPANIKSWLWRVAWLRVLLAFATGATLHFAVLRAPAPAPISKPIGSLVASQPSITMEPAGPIVNSVPQRTFSDADYLVLIWAIGVALMIARMTFYYAAALRLRKQSTPCSDADKFILLTQASRDLGVRIPALLCSTTVKKPLLTGVIRPAIIVPASMPCDASFELVLKHELAHIKRRDLAWNFVGAIAHTFFWFNPLTWLGEREANFHQEVACDELALRNAPARVSEFAALLVDIAARRERSPQLSTVSIIRTRNTLERRLQAMKFIQVKRPRSTIAIAVVLLALMPALIPWRAVAQKSAEPVESKTIEETPEPKQNSEQELLGREIKIVQQQVDVARRAQQYGRASNEDVAKAQRDLLHLQREYAMLEKDTVKARQSMQDELKIVEQLRAEMAKRVENGAASTEDKLKIDREILSLRRQLASLDAAQPAVTEHGAGAGDLSMMYYMSNPELMKRYFPQMYAMMMKNGTNGITNFVQSTNKRPKPAENIDDRMNRNPRIALRLKRTGVVRALNVKSGEHVLKTQPLFWLDEREAQIQLRAAEAQFGITEADIQLRKSELERARELEKERERGLKNSTLPEQERANNDELHTLKMRRLGSELELARIKLEQARLEFEGLTISAPSDGYVGRLPFVGQTVSADFDVDFSPDPPKEESPK